MDTHLALEAPPLPKEKVYLTKGADDFFVRLAAVAAFCGSYFSNLVRGPFEWKEFWKQCYKIGVNSLPLISLTGFIIGIVFTKQSRPALADFGATSWLPGLIGIAVVRALAALVTALVCAGKIGSSIGAELGAMNVTEQIDAMEVSASNPINYLVVTRVTACVLMIPLLMLYVTFVAMAGSFMNVNMNELTSLNTFLTNAFEKITFLDVMGSLIKAVAYGFTIGMVACYRGFHTTKGTEGVGKAANSAVVTAMYFIFIEEVIIVQIISWLR